MKNFYFNTPTQVVFKEEGNSEWLSGIGFEHIIICSCCGDVFAAEDIETYIETDFWVDFSEYIADEGYIEDIISEANNGGDE